MPNGIDISEQEWRPVQAELEPLDPQLRAFAREVDGTVRKDYNGNPGRAIRWLDEVSRSVHVYFSNLQERRLGVMVIAWKDRNDERRIKSEVIASDLTAQELSRVLPELLGKASSVVEAWTEADLESVSG